MEEKENATLRGSYAKQNTSMPDISDKNRNNQSPKYTLKYPAEQKIDSAFSPLLLINWRMARSLHVDSNHAV